MQAGAALLVRNAAAWHYASLAAGFLGIIYLHRHQWFFFDEWAFLQIDGPGLFDPHVGHWSTSPTLIYDLLRSVFTLESYLPFSIAVVSAHLAAAHLIWRIALRAGSNPWIATASVFVFVFLGSGAENILWAFQIGFIGGLVWGLLALYLVTSPELSTRRLAGIVAVSIFGLTWSGTMLPLVAATGLVLWRKFGWKRAVIYVGICATVYLTWYSIFALGSGHNPDTGGFGLEKLFIQMPQFIGVMLIFGFQQVFPLVGLGSAVLLALLIWIIAALRKREKISEYLPALSLCMAAAIFALLSAYSRASFSIGSGQSSRYIYVIVLFLLPVLAVALSSLVGTRRLALITALVLILAVAGYQGLTLYRVARQQAAVEFSSDMLISASLFLYIQDPESIRLDANPDAQWAPDIDMRDLIALYEARYISIDYFTEAELDRARLNVLLSG